eukprot:CAMPEP_0170420628 /NCGR_PEP_ID=MMETSP0117_2-20130122/35449_1 /TAXON_ID=400756 /ORGANISM="Durinskia baltica, Strain CSIRO CS-38" /LENGTH=135 /DNA_ID=CAMNT_0010679089 /DNA_START=14 /DNA_END=418 /DNA_ORIENTATION=-
MDTLVDLLTNVVEISPENTAELEAMVREIHPQGRDVARFPQFLQLVRRLTQDNYLRVNDLAARAVRQHQKKSSKQLDPRRPMSPIELAYGRSRLVGEGEMCALQHSVRAHAARGRGAGEHGSCGVPTLTRPRTST